ncbi:hypothetical protein ZIOFF_043412 [Zingiber officinale]|uniref:Protein argonaute N-terminal domain-containing protein n=1 Tax=Zingiber officinale TaxID=94328 RepID=A0A8J5FX91_ZINOF|nr:hypothetical protein ZIOFF_043412 [Zingiber officinale]
MATAADSPSSSSIGEELRHPTIAEPTKEQTPQPAAPPASSKGLRHPARSDFGTVGRSCLVRANHFLVEIADNTLFHYDVSIVPESVSRATNRKIISELVKAHKDKALGRRMPAYDGRKNLYTAGTFPFKSKEFTVSLPENDGRKVKDFRVIIKLAGNTSIHNLKEVYFGSTVLLFPELWALGTHWRRLRMLEGLLSKPSTNTNGLVFEHREKLLGMQKKNQYVKIVSYPILT